MTGSERRNLLLGLAFIAPFLVGFVAFVLYPLAYNAYLSFTRYTGFGEPVWVGLDNYRRMFFQDGLFWQSLYNTAYYTLLAVPIGVVVALVMALAMNTTVREVAIYRTALVLPSVLPVFAIAFIFVWLLNPRYGLFNLMLSWAGLPPVNWLGDPAWAKLAIVLLAQLGAGQVALIFLAGLRAVPSTLYDAASIDGATVLQRFWHITLPLLTPVILYDLIIGVGLGLQVFTQAYIMTGGGPANATMFYVLYLYRNAFAYSQLGYAAAMSGVLFVINLVLALLVFRWSRSWVRYEVTA